MNHKCIYNIKDVCIRCGGRIIFYLSRPADKQYYEEIGRRRNKQGRFIKNEA
jgi:hypothetical protein